jgi:hypothetical protein
VISEVITIKVVPKFPILITTTTCCVEFLPLILIAVNIIIILYHRIILLHLWISRRHQFNEFIPSENIREDITNLCLTASGDSFCTSVVIVVIEDTQVLEYLILVLIYN